MWSAELQTKVREDFTITEMAPEGLLLVESTYWLSYLGHDAKRETSNFAKVRCSFPALVSVLERGPITRNSPELGLNLSWENEEPQLFLVPTKDLATHQPSPAP